MLKASKSHLFPVKISPNCPNCNETFNIRDCYRKTLKNKGDLFTSKNQVKDNLDK